MPGPKSLFQLTKNASYQRQQNIVHLIASEIFDEQKLERFLSVVSQGPNNELEAFLCSIDDQGKTPLHIAIDQENTAFIKKFAYLGFEEGFYRNYKKTILHYAIENCKLKSVEALLEDGVVLVQMAGGADPLRRGDVDAETIPYFGYFNSSNVESAPNPQTSSNNNPLHYAAFFFPDSIPVLAEKFPAALAEFNSEGLTPAGVALIALQNRKISDESRKISDESFKKLLAYSPNQQISRFHSVLTFQTEAFNFRYCHHMLNDQRLDVNLKTQSGNSAIHQLAEIFRISAPGSNFSGAADLLQKLIEKGADIHSRDSGGDNIFDIMARASDNVEMRGGGQYYQTWSVPNDPNLTQRKRKEMENIFKILFEEGVDYSAATEVQGRKRLNPEGWVGNLIRENISKKAKIKHSGGLKETSASNLAQQSQAACVNSGGARA